MGLIGKLFSKEKSGEEKNGTSETRQFSESLVGAANALFQDGQYDRAFTMYRTITDHDYDVTAQYNLATMYAMGRGTKRDYLKASYWFHKAYLNGDEQAEKMCRKAQMDYIHEGFEQKTPKDLFDEMIEYSRYLYPKEDAVASASRYLYQLGQHHFNKKEYAPAAKLFRSAAEYGNGVEAQNYLAVLYNAGAGVEKNDLAALYWFDRAAEQGFAPAATDRNGILNAYRNNNSPSVFQGIMAELANACRVGTKDIPRDERKAECWEKISDSMK